MLASHIKTYLAYFLASHDGLDEDDLLLAQSEEETALNVFRALFASLNEFEDNKATEDFLACMNSANHKMMLKKLCKRIQDFVGKLRCENDIVTLTGTTSEELSLELDIFITPRRFSEDEEEGYCGSGL